jgi:hypothetical protein
MLRDASSELGLVERLIATDPEGMAEFGGFYGRARERLAPLLSRDRRLFLIEVEGEVVGFLDTDLQEDGAIDVSYFVVAQHRRRGLAAGAIRDFAATLPEGSVVRAAILPSNLASTHTALAAGMTSTTVNSFGETVWELRS